MSVSVSSRGLVSASWGGRHHNCLVQYRIPTIDTNVLLSVVLTAHLYLTPRLYQQTMGFIDIIRLSVALSSSSSFNILQPPRLTSPQVVPLTYRGSSAWWGLAFWG